MPKSKEYSQFRMVDTNGHIVKIGTLSSDEVKARLEGVILGIKICKILWSEGNMSWEAMKENEIYYKEELKKHIESNTKKD